MLLLDDLWTTLDSWIRYALLAVVGLVGIAVLAGLDSRLRPTARWG